MTKQARHFWAKQAIVVSMLLFFIIMLIATSCENHKINGDPTLRGRWVNVDSNSDTIEFTSFDGDPVLSLHRGKEWVQGQWIMKSAGGPYHYKLLDDVISLQWFASSSTHWAEYPFHLSGDRFTIGNFYDKDRRGATEEFRRIP